MDEKKTMVTNCDTLLLNLVQRRQIGLQCISVAEPLPNMPVLLDLSPSTGNFLKEQRGELFSSQKWICSQICTVSQPAFKVTCPLTRLPPILLWLIVDSSGLPCLCTAIERSGFSGGEKEPFEHFDHQYANQIQLQTHWQPMRSAGDILTGDACRSAQCSLCWPCSWVSKISFQRCSGVPSPYAQMRFWDSPKAQTLVSLPLITAELLLGLGSGIW